jgi:hypothetical protein
MKRKTPGKVHTVRMPENTKKLRLPMLRSPQRWERRQSTSLRISDRSVSRILHSESISIQLRLW